MGFFNNLTFSRLKQGLAKTRESLLGKVQKVLLGKSRIDDEVIDRLEEVLLSGDVGVSTTQSIIERIRARVKKDHYEDTEQLNTLLREEIRNVFANGQSGIAEALPSSNVGKPYVVMIVGVNGVGKTTTIGKLAYSYKSAGKTVVIAAADTFRAAANEQLEIWAHRAGVDIVQHRHGADPAAVAYDALSAAIARHADVLIIDTAGRLHTKVTLMEELKKIGRVLQKLIADAPHEVLLVLDASTGQNAIQQAKQFTAAVGVSGLVLTKLDGTAKGGVVLAISHELSIPVKYIGVGERIDDLQPFDKATFVDALFEKG